MVMMMLIALVVGMALAAYGAHGEIRRLGRERNEERRILERVYRVLAR